MSRPRPLAIAAAALVLGTTLGLDGRLTGLFPVLGFGALVIGVLAWIREERDLVALAVLIGILAAGAAIGSEERRIGSADCRRAWANGEVVDLRVRASTYLPVGERGSAEVHVLQTEPAPGCRWTGPLRIFAEGPLVPGKLYRLRGRWRPMARPGRLPRPPERLGWLAVDRLTPVPGPGGWHPFLHLRGWLAGQLWESYPRHWAPLVEALVLGQRTTIEPERYRRLAHAGLAHLLAISGLHVGLLAGALLGLARMLRLAPDRARLSSLVAIFAYVALIGAPASALRAAVMIGLWTLCRLAGRPSAPFDVIGLAALVLLVIEPWHALSPGFQLSFAGVSAIVAAHRVLRDAAWFREAAAPVRAVVASLALSLATTALTAPITAYHFGRVAPAAVLGNLLAIPLLGLAMPALFASALLSFWPWAAAWAASAAIVPLAGIEEIGRALSELEWGSLDVARPGLPAVAGYLGLVWLGGRALRGARDRQRLVLALGATLCAVLLAPGVQSRLGAGRLEVYVLDVGQGEAIAVATPGRRWLLVDAGPRAGGFDAGRRRVVPFFRGRGVRRLEGWLISHPDLDHVGGGPAVLDALEVARVIGPGRVTGQAGQLPVLARLAETRIPWLRGDEGDELHLDGVELVFLHPEDDDDDSADPKGENELLEPRTRVAVGVGGREDPNESSLVFFLQYGEFRMLFTGDAPGAVEARLARRVGEALEAAVLKVSHHGSASSSVSGFLERVRPKLAVISAGRRNRYGHPSPLVLGRLRARGIEVRRTDRDGTIVIEARRDGSWSVRSAAEGF